MENHGVLFNNWRRIVSPVVDDLQNGHGLHYEASGDLLEQIRALRKEEREKERMKQAAAGQLSDKVALPIYGAVLALIGLDANRRISAETAVKACQWSVPPEKPEGCGVPAYSVAADIEERRRKSERAEAIETAVLVEFARLAARDEYEAASQPAVAAPEPVAPPAEPVPDADRPPTVQQAIAPYVAKLMQERPNYTAEDLYQRMRRDAGGDDSPFSRLEPGGELFSVDAGNNCGISSVRRAHTDCRKTLYRRRSSTVEVPSNP